MLKGPGESAAVHVHKLKILCRCSNKTDRVQVESVLRLLLVRCLCLKHVGYVIVARPRLGCMRCMVECTPIKVLKLFHWPMTTPSHH